MPLLTKRGLEVLRLMVEAEGAKDDYGASIVRDGGTCYLGDVRISSRTVDQLLRLVAVSLAYEDGRGYELFVVNGTGTALSRHPERVEAVYLRMMKGGAFYVAPDGRIVEM